MRKGEGLVITPFLAAPHVKTLVGFKEAGGLQALVKVVRELGVGGLLRTIKDSGLRERDANAFPTAMKWEFLSRSGAAQKFLMVPLDSCEPGCVKDLWLIENSPHLIVEGALIAAIAVGATGLIFLVRHDRPLHFDLIQGAWDDFRREGMLNHPISAALGEQGFEIRRGPGVYLGNEETALVGYMEGKKPCGKVRPHFPVVQGYKGFPTLITGPETLVNLPFIINRGSDWFSRLGTPTNPGTRLLSVTGRIKKPGVYEVAIGTSLREVLAVAGGGRISETIGAVVTGGVGSGILPPDLFDVALDHQPLAKVRCNLGNGVLLVLPGDMCVVDQVRRHLQFFRDVSCGECVPCREGLRQLVEAFCAVTDSRSRSAYERNSLRVSGSPPPFGQLLSDLAETIRGSGRCSLGRQAVNSFFSLVEHFPEALEDHYIRRECSREVCRIK